MDMSHELARVFGVVMVVVYGGILFNQGYYYRVWQAVVHQPLILFISGFMGLILGVITLVLHPVWVLGWPVIITLLGLLMTVQGIVRIFFPEFVMRKAENMLKKEDSPVLRYAYVVMLLIGLFLVYMSLV